jgi:hypothetical protein
MHLRTYRLLWVLISISLSGTSCFAQTSPVEKESVEIVGEVVIQYSEKTTLPGYAGRTFPWDKCPIYLFNWEESIALRDWLGKLEHDIKAANEDPGNSQKWWIVEKRREDAYKLTTGDITAKRAKTDDKGRFFFKDLKPAQKYLVIATDDVHEVGIVLLYQTVGPLKPGTNEVRLVDKN